MSESPVPDGDVLTLLTPLNESDRDSFGDLIPVPAKKTEPVHEGSDEMPTPDSPDQILQRLFLGDRSDGQSEGYIRELGITHVLNVHTSCRFPSEDCGYSYLHEPMSDFGDDDLTEFLPKVMPFILTGLTSGKVLVHCQMGVNRSATIVICYLMVHQRFTLHRAYWHTQALRPRISPHELYFEQMQRMEAQLFGNVTLTREDVGPSFQQMLRDFRAKAKLERAVAENDVPESVD